MSIIERLEEQFSFDRIGRYLASDLLPDLIVSVFTFLAFYLVWRVVKRGLRYLERTDLDETARAFVEQVVKYGILAMGLVSALGQFGIDTSSILTSLGVAGLTIGFAAKDTLSNVISGLFIFWDRPFVVDDLIEIDGQYGRVEEITMRSTRVVTTDGRMLAIPNSSIVNTTVASYTNFPNLRIEVDVTVSVEENLGRIRQLLLEMVAGDERFLDDPPPAVVATALNDYNVALQFRAWLKDERARIPVRFETRERVFETLREAGVDMPYETLALTPVEVTTKAA